ncbi:MAG: hypothetical protein VKJ64_10945 [Leptolyngbyaceae bacterium]|nr:hypothetical protein [Leptolyngbyaceae bacterium]
MTYNTTTQVSGADRVVVSLLAAGMMFVTGYTAVRVSLAQPAADYDASVQINVVPHEGTLWADGF